MHLKENVVLRWTVWLSRLVLALVFVFAGAVKAMDPKAFAEEIMRYQLAPWPAAVVLALWLPFLEIAAGTGLLLPKLRAGAQAVLTVLLLAFTVALLSAWRRGLDIDCGCFGTVAGHQDLVHALVRDGILLGLLGWIWIQDARSSRLPLPQPTSPVPSP